MLDYRKCSYKDRLRILRDLEGGSAFFDTKPGQRLLKSVREKMDAEGFSKDDFGEQKKSNDVRRVALGLDRNAATGRPRSKLPKMTTP